ncbi:unnamed protein product [Brugia timori]|uniref:Uncharacterized protein n=1 Tax=Brugia timori TaxID=42155 RepID=A0A0R3R7L1_9BILA|nr:unnamed protein product [Brugia timori]
MLLIQKNPYCLITQSNQKPPRRLGLEFNRRSSNSERIARPDLLVAV